MASFLQWFLPLYGLAAFFALVVVKAWYNWKKYGINPVIISQNDDVHSLIGRFLTRVLLIIGITIAIYSFFPHFYSYLLPIHYLEIDWLQKTGILLLILSLLWTMYAQYEMRSSWRIGIDHDAKTELVTNGIFRLSRNPIYVGVVVMMLGLFLTIPNAISLLVLGMCSVLVPIQVRLEEAYLTNIHGQDFADYCKRVRRWL